MSVIVTRRSRSRPRSRVLSIARRLDWLVLAATAGLAALGLTVLGDATRHDVAGDPGYYVRRQTIYFVVGGLGMIAMSAIDPALWRRLRMPLYFGTLGLVTTSQRISESPPHLNVVGMLLHPGRQKLFRFLEPVSLKEQRSRPLNHPWIGRAVLERFD